MSEQSKYKSLSEWRKSDKLAYQSAKDKGLIPKICKEFGWEIPKSKIKWTLDKCKKKSIEYISILKWKQYSPDSYKSAFLNNWIDECIEYFNDNSAKREFIRKSHIITMSDLLNDDF